MNRIFFKEQTSLNTIKKILLELNPYNIVGYKIFLSYDIFSKLQNFIKFNQLENFEFWVDITECLDIINDNNNKNIIYYYNFGKNSKITNIIKAKTKLSINKTLVVQINLNRNTFNDILKIWNYECDILIEKDNYSFEKIKDFFLLWKNKRNNFSKKILDFDNLFNNSNYPSFIFEIDNKKIVIKNILNHSFSIRNTIKEIEEEISKEELFCESCKNCSLQKYCKTSLNNYEGLQNLYTENLLFNCQITSFLLNSIQQIKEDADEKFNFSRQAHQSV